MPIKLTEKPADINPNEPTKIMRQEDVVMSWQAREFIQYDRNPGWMLVVYVVSALILIYAIWTMNFLFAVLVVLSVIVIQIYTKRKPLILNVAIMKKGFKINNTLYTYEDDLEKFWILYNPPDLKTLVFKRKQAMFPNLVIQLEDRNPIKIREYLLRYLPEDVTQEESSIDRFARRIGF